VVDTGGRRGPPASWLFHAEGDTPIIYIDVRLLEAAVRFHETEERLKVLFPKPHESSDAITESVTDSDASRDYLFAKMRSVVTGLLLHEIGHVALHWKALEPKTRDVDFVSAATARHEFEAWLFAGTILGFALGEIAQHVVECKTIDNAWNYLIQQQYPTS